MTQIILRPTLHRILGGDYPWRLSIVCCHCVDPPLYVSESGSDETGKGTEKEPVKTILKVVCM